MADSSLSERRKVNYVPCRWRRAQRAERQNSVTMSLVRVLALGVLADTRGPSHDSSRRLIRMVGARGFETELLGTGSVVNAVDSLPGEFCLPRPTGSANLRHATAWRLNPFNSSIKTDVSVRCRKETLSRTVSRC